MQPRLVSIQANANQPPEDRGSFWKKKEWICEIQSYLSAVEEAFLWHITANELLPSAISCLISHATRLLGFTARKLMPDWNHTLQRRGGGEVGEREREFGESSKSTKFTKAHRKQKRK